MNDTKIVTKNGGVSFITINKNDSLFNSELENTEDFDDSDVFNNNTRASPLQSFLRQLKIVLG